VTPAVRTASLATVTAALTLAVGGGCPGPGPTRAGPEAAPVPPRASTLDAAPALAATVDAMPALAVTPDAAPAHPALRPATYVSVGLEGVVRIEAGGVLRRVTGLPVWDLALGGDGRVYAASGKVVLAIDDDDVRDVALDPALTYPNAIATGPRAGGGVTLWVAAKDALGRLEVGPSGPGTWQVLDKAALGLGPGRLLDVVVAGAGAVYATDGKVVVRRGEGDAVFVPLPPLPRTPLVRGLVVDAAGRAAAATTAGLYLAGVDGWTAVDLGFVDIEGRVLRQFSIDAVSAGVGDAWLVSHRDQVVVQGGRGIRTRIELADRGVATSRVVSLALDAGARGWLGTEAGLVVLDRSGTVVHRWPAGSEPLLTGELRAILVVGEGPDLAGASAPPAPVGDVRGRLRAGGAAVVGAELELCTDLRSTGTASTPCGFEPGAIRTRTDRAGAFVLSGVAPGTYHLMVKRQGEGWRELTDAACCQDQRPGQPLDLGVLRAP
jgi:hypothetical protein